ncbi:MAG: hypothetical protein JXL80_03255 [Planctomycetes bacterium]|nr:hypothetical protein [Planctomycetota bacterium]
MAKPSPRRTSRLTHVGPQRTFTGEDRAQIAFPLGGIGTGSISLGGWGQLRDFEIFNRPAKGQTCPMTFLTLYACRDGDRPVTRVLQGPLAGPREFAHGIPCTDGAGLPHFAGNRFTGTFPIARIDFDDAKVPLRVSMEAFNPMIPLEADDSSLPVAVLLVHLKNPAVSKSVRAVVTANLRNMAGHPDLGRNVTEYVEEKGVRGLAMSTRKHAKRSPQFGSMALATPWRRVQVQTRWPRLPVFDQLELFWDQASAGRLDDRRDRVTSDDGCTDVGSIALSVNLKPGQEAALPILIAWHVPNVRKYWDTALGNSCKCETSQPVWRNHYASLFADAWAVARHAAKNLRRLEDRTRRFAETFYGSTLPAHVLDAAGSQMSILKTTTCLRLPDGSFYGWEGCHPDAGCCEGTCTHVWNYAQTPAALYPGLQASALENHLKYSMLDDGAMVFRLPLPLGTRGQASFHAAADGQMGVVLGVYRHWRSTGDDAWLGRWWPQTRKAIEYAWKYWDRDRDGVMEGLQHNTYDIEFYGPNTMMGSLYLAALKAGAAMADRMGDADAAQEYRRLAESGKRWMDEHLWCGDYYIQKVDPAAARLTPIKKTLFAQHRQDRVLAPDEPPYQYGRGCLSDQLIGQWYAHMLGLGYLFDRDHVRGAMRSIFRYNFRTTLTDHVNTHRVYAVGDEAGLLACTWPHGMRETNPFLYAHEIWPGMEYQVAAHLVYEGMIEEGLAIVKAARDRHDGYHRNPWNEVECGNHYARSMSSWALVWALSGFRYAAPEQRVVFAPKVHRNDFRTFFSTGGAWGRYSQKTDKQGGCATIDVIGGKLPLHWVVLGVAAGRRGTKARVRQGKRNVPCTCFVDEEGALEFAMGRTVTVAPGRPLDLRWSNA